MAQFAALKLYRYAHDNSGRTFTETEWLDKAYDHFIRLDDDTEGTYLLFLVNDIWMGHLRHASIIEADSQGKERGAVTSERCPFCRRSPNDVSYPFLRRPGDVNCLHVEDIYAVQGIEPGDSVYAEESGPYYAVEGVIRAVHRRHGFVTVRDTKNGAEYLVRGARIRSHTKAKDITKSDADSATTPKRKKAKT